MKAQEPTFDLTYDEFMKAAREVIARSEAVTTPFGKLTVLPRYIQETQND